MNVRANERSGFLSAACSAQGHADTQSSAPNQLGLVNPTASAGPSLDDLLKAGVQQRIDDTGQGVLAAARGGEVPDFRTREPL